MMNQILPATTVSTPSSDDSLNRYRKLLKQLTHAISSHSLVVGDTHGNAASLDGLVCPSCDEVFDTHKKDCQLQLL